MAARPGAGNQGKRLPWFRCPLFSQNVKTKLPKITSGFTKCEKSRSGNQGKRLPWFPGRSAWSWIVGNGIGFGKNLIYLLFIPLLLFYWMNNRWNIMGKFERLGIYGLVFLFFPGLILFSPFLNLRLKGSGKG